MGKIDAHSLKIILLAQPTKQSTGWLNASSIQVSLVFNDHPLLIIQASGITEEKFISALHKQPSFSTGGLLWDIHL